MAAVGLLADGTRMPASAKKESHYLVPGRLSIRRLSTTWAASDLQARASGDSVDVV
jgi:hypothetical protein